MNILAELLSSKTRAEIFRILFSNQGKEIHNREIERQSGICESGVRRELNRLVRLGIVNRREDGNRVYYSANATHPLHPDLRSLVLKTAGLADVLRKALAAERIRLAFVFGSLARGEEKAGSDVDLMVVGDLGLRRLATVLGGVQEAIGRQVNPYVLTTAEFLKRQKAHEHFLTAVLNSPKLFIIGTEHELASMA